MLPCMREMYSSVENQENIIYFDIAVQEKISFGQ